jgi:hypothetical protein
MTHRKWYCSTGYWTCCRSFVSRAPALLTTGPLPLPPARPTLRPFGQFISGRDGVSVCPGLAHGRSLVNKTYAMLGPSPIQYPLRMKRGSIVFVHWGHNRRRLTAQISDSLQMLFIGSPKRYFQFCQCGVFGQPLHGCGIRTVEDSDVGVPWSCDSACPWLSWKKWHNTGVLVWNVFFSSDWSTQIRNRPRSASTDGSTEIDHETKRVHGA